VLLTELNSHFPDDFKSGFEDVPEVLADILRNGREAAANAGFGEFVSLARNINEKWAGTVTASAPANSSFVRIGPFIGIPRAAEPSGPPVLPEPAYAAVPSAADNA
jgi:hypothetical protein